MEASRTVTSDALSMDLLIDGLARAEYMEEAEHYLKLAVSRSQQRGDFLFCGVFEMMCRTSLWPVGHSG